MDARKPWTQHVSNLLMQEDEALIAVVDQIGNKNWSEVSSMMNS